MTHRSILVGWALCSILSLSGCTFSFGVAGNPTQAPIAVGVDPATQTAAMATIEAALTHQPTLATPTPTPDLTKAVVIEKAAHQAAVEATLTAIAARMTSTPTPNLKATQTAESAKIKMAVAATLTAIPSPRQAPGGTSAPHSYDDEFSTKLSNQNWQWVNEGQWMINPFFGRLRLIATKGDMAGPCTNHTNLLLQEAPAGRFEIETKLSISPTANQQQGGLLLFTDADNYLKLNVAYSSAEYQSGVIVEFRLETDGQLPPPSRFGLWRSLTSGDNVYLQIERSKDLSGEYFFIGRYSTDGKTWHPLGSLSSSKLKNPRIGVFALAGVVNDSCVGDAPDLPVDFDYFRLRFK